jgi:hypothetical protein
MKPNSIECLQVRDSFVVKVEDGPRRPYNAGAILYYNGSLSIVYEGEGDDRAEAVRKAAAELRGLL